MDEGKTIRWIKGVPPDRPVCGYSGELCVEGEIEVSFKAALDKLSSQYWNIRIYHECEGRIEKSVPRIAVWHHDS